MVALKTEPAIIGETAKLYLTLPESVIVLFGARTAPTAKALTSSSGLFRLLRRLGRQRVPLLCVIKGGEMLTPRSLGALNIFLHAGRGLRFWRSGMGPTKYGWRDLQEQIALEWRPLTPQS